MEPENQTDHIALLALMICGTLIKRMDEVGQLDEATAKRLHRLVEAVRTHAKRHNAADLKILFDNIELSIGDKLPRIDPVS
ncbi:MAG: hypothetical protein ABW128_03535 [Rhizorhabdus sp.]